MPASRISRVVGSPSLELFRAPLQFAAIILAALIAGSTFGIWRGYDPYGYSAQTFFETHRGAVEGLNLLLPLMGIAVLVLIGLLAVDSRRQRSVFWIYLAAFAFMAAAGVITRFVNQPINDEVMAWLPGAMPGDWMAIRDSWWNWHVARTLFSLGGLAVLVAAVLRDRGGVAER